MVKNYNYTIKYTYKVKNTTTYYYTLILTINKYNYN